MKLAKALPLVAVLVLWACGDSGGGDAGSAQTQAAPEESGFTLDFMRMTTTPSGLRYEDVKVGDGTEATAGRTAIVHYTGWLMDGRKFDSSRDRNEPFDFVLGQRQVIVGWDEGVQGMKVGGQRRLVIPPDLGYGESGFGGVIPPGATLVFDVELLEVR